MPLFANPTSPSWFAVLSTSSITPSTERSLLCVSSQIQRTSSCTCQSSWNENQSWFQICCSSPIRGIDGKSFCHFHAQCLNNLKEQLGLDNEDTCTSQVPQATSHDTMLKHMEEHKMLLLPRSAKLPIKHGSYIWTSIWLAKFQKDRSRGIQGTHQILYSPHP